MRNVFDQYGQTENRVSHALLTALNEDRLLLGRFLRELVGVTPPVPPRQLTLYSQRYPGEMAPTEDEAERRGIPDGWIFDIDAEWCAFIEAKVQATLSLDQLARHRRAAERLGFHTIVAIVIASNRDLPRRAPRDAVLLRWRDVYEWLVRYRAHDWAARAAEYLEIVEARLIETEKFSEGTLTMFAGFPFGRDRPYTYLEGKRTLLLACEALRTSRKLQKQLGVDPRIDGRSKITGSRADLVWDFVAIAGGNDAAHFTRYPHLSLGVGLRYVVAMVTIPNAVNSRTRRALRDIGEDGFRDVLAQILKNMNPLMRANPRAVPLVQAVQRRWQSINSKPHLHARIDFDIRTAVPGSNAVVHQPQWLTAAYGALVRKRGANYELQVGVEFSYDECPGLRQASAIQMVEEAWLACKPLVDVVR